HAGRKTTLPDCGGLLIAGNAQDRNRSTEQISTRFAECARAIAHIREHPTRHSKQPAEVVVPLAFADIEQQRTRRVGGVRQMNGAAGEPPEQETVDGAKGEPALLGGLASAFQVIKQPADLACGKIWI